MESQGPSQQFRDTLKEINSAPGQMLSLDAGMIFYTDILYTSIINDISILQTHCFCEKQKVWYLTSLC